MDKAQIRKLIAEYRSAKDDLEIAAPGTFDYRRAFDTMSHAQYELGKPEIAGGLLDEIARMQEALESIMELSDENVTAQIFAYAALHPTALPVAK